MGNEMYTFYYGQGTDLSEDVKELLIYNEADLFNILEGIHLNNQEKELVYLFCLTPYQDDSFNINNNEILITSNLKTITEEIKECIDSYAYTTMNLHEYESFESAYSVALNMREGGSLCYDTEK